MVDMDIVRFVKSDLHFIVQQAKYFCLTSVSRQRPAKDAIEDSACSSENAYI